MLNNAKTNVEGYQEKIFEEMKHVDEVGNEFWKAKELMKVLGYSKWGNFKKVIDKSKIICGISNNNSKDHFLVKGKIVKSGATIKEVINYKLSRYTCYYSHKIKVLNVVPTSGKRSRTNFQISNSTIF